MPEPRPLVAIERQSGSVSDICLSGEASNAFSIAAIGRAEGWPPGVARGAPPHAAPPIRVEPPSRGVKPPPLPSFPAEALSFLSMRQMAPDLLLHPVFDEAEALAGMPHREVVHPSP